MENSASTVSVGLSANEPTAVPEMRNLPLATPARPFPTVPAQKLPVNPLSPVISTDCAVISGSVSNTAVNPVSCCWVCTVQAQPFCEHVTGYGPPAASPLIFTSAVLSPRADGAAEQPAARPTAASRASVHGPRLGATRIPTTPPFVLRCVRI